LRRPPDEQRVGDALAEALGQLATAENPPAGVVREAAGWIGHELDLFAEEFANSAGQLAGKADVVGVGAGLLVATSKVSGLSAAVHNLLGLLGE